MRVSAMRGAGNMPTINSNGPNNGGWVAAAIRVGGRTMARGSFQQSQVQNPVLNRFRTSPLPAFLRSNSQPVHEETQANGRVDRGRRFTTDGHSQRYRQPATSTVIQMENEEGETSSGQRA